MGLKTQNVRAPGPGFRGRASSHIHAEGRKLQHDVAQREARRELLRRAQQVPLRGGLGVAAARHGAGAGEFPRGRGAWTGEPTRQDLKNKYPPPVTKYDAAVTAGCAI